MTATTRSFPGIRRRALAFGAAAAAAVALIAPGAARAATTEIGLADATPGFNCVGPSTYFQQASGTGPNWTVPAGGGVITSWKTLARTVSGAQVKFAVFRGSGSTFTTIGSSSTETIQANQLNSFSTQIPVQGGDTIGLLILSGSHECALFGGAPGGTGQRDQAAVHDTGSTFTYTDPNPAAAINVAATVSPNPRTLTLDANKNKVKKGKKVRLSGQLSSSTSPSCASGQTVTLEKKSKKQTSFTPFEQLQTDAQGKFSAKVKVKKTTKFRAEVAEAGACDDAVSSKEKVKVKKKAKKK